MQHKSQRTFSLTFYVAPIGHCRPTAGLRCTHILSNPGLAENDGYAGPTSNIGVSHSNHDRLNCAKGQRQPHMLMHSRCVLLVAFFFAASVLSIIHFFLLNFRSSCRHPRPFSSNRNDTMCHGLHLPAHRFFQNVAVHWETCSSLSVQVLCMASSKVRNLVENIPAHSTTEIRTRALAILAVFLVCLKGASQSYIVWVVNKTIPASVFSTPLQHDACPRTMARIMSFVSRPSGGYLGSCDHKPILTSPMYPSLTLTPCTKMWGLH